MKDFKMLVKEFRMLTVNETYDLKYNFADKKAHDIPWSRVYEYPLILSHLKDHYESGMRIHNSSWGFAGVHVTFKNELEKLYTGQVDNSDIKKSALDNTFIYDITKKPPTEMIKKYDIVLNVSTMEEVDFDHVEVFNNLFSQVKEGGTFIATFDLPGLQIEKFETLFKQKITSEGTLLNGDNSIAKNHKYSNLNVGLMVVTKQ